MTTPLNKTVARKSSGHGPNRRQFVVTICPGDAIGFRDANCRKTYWLTLRGCYELAIKAEVFADRRAKAAAKKARKFT